MKKYKLKILFCEDNPSDAELVQRFLKKTNFTFTAKVVDARDKYIKALKNFSPDIILSDHQLPQFDSFGAMKILKEKKINIPFILVTGTVSEEFAAVIIKEGADDYILKNNLTRLPNAILTALKQKQTENEKEKYQEQLEEKIKELNTFIYRISHDLKSPLASTLGLLTLARNDIRDKNCLGYFDLIEKSNKKMEAILMSFSEVVQISQQKTTDENINFKNLAEEIIANLKNIPGAEKIKFTVHSDAATEWFGNKAMMNSVLQNLIHNTINYRREISDSFVSVNISETKKYVVIKISDNGIGIEKELLPKIFDMFYRGTVSSKGSGLGLYIVKTAVEKVGGKVEVKSTQGERSVFTISLPK